MEAAANPARTRELFFVADGTGGHAFSETYDQHQKNVAKLRGWKSRSRTTRSNRPPRQAQPAAAGAPADTQSDRDDTGPAAPKKPAARRSAGRPGDPPAAPARQGAAQSTTSAGGSALAPFPRRNRIPLWRENVLMSQLLLRIPTCPPGEIQAMALSSMTGFARSHGASGPYACRGNSSRSTPRGLTCGCGCRPGWDAIEALAKKRAGEVLSRGTVYATLTVKRANAVSDRPYQRGRCWRRSSTLPAVLAGKVDAEAPSIDGLLSTQGRDRGGRGRKQRGEDKAAEAAIVDGFEQALTDLAEMRRREGVTLGQILSAAAGRDRSVWPRAEAAPGRRPEAVKERLAEQIAALLDASDRFDPDRLHSGGDPDRSQGRYPRRTRPARLAYRASAQDDGKRRRRSDDGSIFWRRNSTAKPIPAAPSRTIVELTNIGLELKSVVEQFREQVQNLE